MDNESREKYILKGLLSFSDYASKFLDKLSPSHFSPEMKLVIKGIQQYYNKYHKSPPLRIICDNIIAKVYKNDDDKREYAEDFIHEANNIQIKKEDFYDWLVDETKSFIKNQCMREAIVQAVEHVEKGDMDAAVKIVQEAGSLDFDDDLGLDYFEDLEKRAERMKIGEHVIPTGITLLDNKIGGGWHNKSLNIFGAATNVGKTLIMSDTSAKLIRQGHNGLYITLEIYEDLLANRVDANLTNIELSGIDNDPDLLMRTLLNMKKQAESNGNPFGRFIIKEYAPNCLNSNGLLALVRELEMKRNGFKPDFICIDYIGLMAPNMKVKGEGTYGNLKRVAEELRSVASILDVPIFSAVQVNRDAYNSSHVGLENTSDSMGIPMTADLMIMVSRDESLDEENRMYWYIAKSRFSRNGDGFPVIVDYPHMRITCEEDSSDVKDQILQAKKAKMSTSFSNNTNTSDSNVHTDKKDNNNGISSKKIDL